MPVPDLPGYKTLKADFHLHTVFSDGEVWPTTRVAEAWRDGLDVIALTDHTDYQPHTGDVNVDLTRPHELAKGLADAAGIISCRSRDR
jgi:histidinol phosphatase-like PHP family hydrolase